jgi:hypothetical protein
MKLADAKIGKAGWGDPSFWSGDEAKEVETDFFTFTSIGATLIGQLIEKGEAPVRGELVGRYTFRREDGTNVACHGTMQLDDKMTFVNVGSIVRIEYTGDQKTQNGSLKNFSVQERMTAASGS